MTCNTQDMNLSWYVPKANVDHTIRGQGTSTLDHSATTPWANMGIWWSPLRYAFVCCNPSTENLRGNITVHAPWTIFDILSCLSPSWLAVHKRSFIYPPRAIIAPTYTACLLTYISDLHHGSGTHLIRPLQVLLGRSRLVDLIRPLQVLLGSSKLVNLIRPLQVLLGQITTCIPN